MADEIPRIPGLFQVLAQSSVSAYPCWSVVHLFETAPKVRSKYIIWNFVD